MQSWIAPFLITISYLVISTYLGITAKGKLDMSVQENWATAGNSLGLFALVFLIGAGNVSAYTFLGSPGWAWAKGVPALYVVVYLCTMALTAYLLNPRVSILNQKYNIMTEPEGFGIRFESKALRILSAVVAVIASIGAAMVQAIGVGYILNVMSGGSGGDDAPLRQQRGHDCGEGHHAGLGVAGLIQNALRVREGDLLQIEIHLLRGAVQHGAEGGEALIQVSAHAGVLAALSRV